MLMGPPIRINARNQLVHVAHQVRFWALQKTGHDDCTISQTITVFLQQQCWQFRCLGASSHLIFSTLCIEIQLTTKKQKEII
ncbi:hypothetical protein YQ44_14240 [Janthinobacterium sp. 1_2014MBL_MicDiv]|nr:hypothetical protein YQ44_14240 [Janthinobacterium sp. 1_2014MBL_MicDiv]